MALLPNRWLRAYHRRRRTSGLGQILFLAVVVVLAAGSIAYAISAFAGRLQDNRTWLRSVAIEQASAVTVDLFKRAAGEGLIRVERDKRRLDIVMVRCENTRHPVAGDPAAPAVQASPANRVLLRLLCDSPQGEAIRAEIEQWNASFRFVGVRDDRPRNQPCEQGYFIPVGCKTASEWSALRTAPDRTTTPAPVQENISPPPREFAMLALDLKPRFGDWAVFEPSSDDATTYQLSTRLRLAGTVNIDVVGTPISVTVGGATANLPATGTTARVAVGGVTITRTLLCNRIDSEATKECTRPPAEALPHAYRLTLTGPGARDVQLAITVRALNVLPRPLVTDDPEEEVEFRERRTAHIEMKCEGAPRGGNECKVDWSATAAIERGAPVQHRIVARDGRTPLLDPEGRIVAEAFDQGLSSIIGLGPQDVGSLAATLARSSRRTPVTVQLTIDPSMQRQAQLALATAVGKCGADGQTGCKVADDQAALVFVDAEERPGEILAMAMWPPVPRGLHIWDHAALQLGGGARSAVSGFAWRSTNADTTPGSTFKLVTAIAAAERVIAGDVDIAKLVRGQVNVDESARMLGLRRGARTPAPGCEDDPKHSLPVPLHTGTTFKCLHNFAGSPYDGAVRPVSTSQCPGSPGQSRLGLCEAIMTSSNLWFSGIALRMDRQKVARLQGTRWIESPERPKDLDLVKTMERLFPTEKYLDLLSGRVRTGEPAQPPPPGQESPLAAPARLLADPVQMAAGREAAPGEPRQLQIAQAGFGQAIASSPLAIATVFATIGAERIVRPHLMRRDPSAPRDPEEGTPIFAQGPEALRKEMMTEIRSGMRAVVMSGTAVGAFQGSPIRDRVFGKTGTATIRNDERWTLWFAGFIEGRPGSGIPRRMAFACMITHQEGGTGGGVCAPLIRRLLEQMDTRRQ